MSTSTDNAITIPEGIITAGMLRKLTQSFSGEGKALLGLNKYRFNQCLALGAIRKALEESDAPRGSFKHWLETDENVVGRITYSKAMQYAKVGMHEFPETAFEEYKERDSISQEKYKARRAEAARVAAAAAVANAAATAGTPSVPPSAGQSDAGKDSRSTETADVPPTMTELADSAKLAIRSLASSNQTGTERETSKRAEMAVAVARDIADSLGIPQVSETGIVVEKDTDASRLAGWLLDNWSKTQRDSLAKILTGDDIPLPASKPTRKRTKKAMTPDGFAKVVSGMAASQRANAAAETARAVRDAKRAGA